MTSARTETLVISDASALIALLGIDQIDLLRKLYERILTTDVVRDEVHTLLPEWIEISVDYDAQQYRLLRLELDAGEASAIALALRRPQSGVILDERKGRMVAKRMDLRVLGTLGIIVNAKEAGLITSAKELIDRLEVHGFWLSHELRQRVLRRLGEGNS